MSAARTRPRSLALALVLVAFGAIAVALLGEREAAASKPPREFYGVVPQTDLEPGDFAQMQSDGVGMVRQLLHWPWIEPQQGEYNWGYVDSVMAQASAVGISVWPVLYGTPRWALSSELERRCGETCAPASAEARAGFARFAAAAVSRYGPGGSFWAAPPPPPNGEPPPENPCQVPPLLCRRQAAAGIEAWQVWNEQNSPKYFGPKVRVGSYAQLLRETATAMREANSEIEVVLGGMWGPPSTDAVLPTVEYLAKLYREPQIEASFDSIAVHPYAGRFASVVNQVGDINDFVRKAGDPDVGLWVTELGWASSGPRAEPLVKSPREQAGLLRRSYRFLIGKRSSWNIRGVHWYAWRDTGGAAGICKWCPKSGLRKADGSPKPAAEAFRKLPRA